MVWPVVAALTVAGPTVTLTATTARLGAADFQARESAARTLRAAGPLAVAPLTTAARSTDPEVRRQATALLGRLETQRFGSPTLVSLHADHAQTDAVIAELARQTGYRLSIADRDGPPLPAVTLHRDRVPFWAAVDVLCEAGGLTFTAQDNGTIEFRPGDAGDPFACYAGPFRLTATDISAGQRRQLAGLPRRGLPPAEPDTLIVSFALTAEPKAVVVGLEPAVHEATDDRGLSLKPPADGHRASLFAPVLGRRSSSHTFALDLQRSNRDGSSIRTLRGAVAVALLSGTSPELAIDRPAEAKGRTAKGKRHTLTVDAVAAGDVFALDLTVTRAAEATDGWQAGLHERLELTDATGAAWPVCGVAYHDGDDHVARCRVEFRPPVAGAKPARLTLVEWRTVTREVAFAFKDIPLP